MSSRAPNALHLLLFIIHIHIHLLALVRLAYEYSYGPFYLYSYASLHVTPRRRIRIHVFPIGDSIRFAKCFVMLVHLIRCTPRSDIAYWRYCISLVQYCSRKLLFALERSIQLVRDDIAVLRCIGSIAPGNSLFAFVLFLSHYEWEPLYS